MVDATALNKSGLANIEVTLVGDGKPQTTKTDSDGYFSFSGVSFTAGLMGGATDHTLQIEADGYADTEVYFDIEDPQSRVSVAKNLGQVGLSPTTTLTVNVTEDGSLIGHDAPVVAMPDWWSGPNGLCDNTFVGAYNLQRSTATTSGGSAELTIAECAWYDVYVPAHGDGGDLPAKYLTASYGLYDPQNSDPIIALGLTPATRNDGISVVDSSFDNPFTVAYDESARSDTYTTWTTFINTNLAQSHGNPIKVVFNYPVTIPNGAAIEISRFQEDPDTDGDGVQDPGYGDWELISASASVDSTGTILTITPDNWSTVPTNSALWIRGELVAETGGTPMRADLADFGTEEIYVADGTAMAIDDITVDNYTDGGVGSVWVEFPDYVRGELAVRSYDSGGGEILTGNSPAPFSVSDIWWTDGSAGEGVDAGTFAVSDLGRPLNDGNTITIDFSMDDADGNHYNFSKTFTVQ